MNDRGRISHKSNYAEQPPGHLTISKCTGGENRARTVNRFGKKFLVRRDRDQGWVRQKPSPLKLQLCKGGDPQEPAVEQNSYPGPSTRSTPLLSSNGRQINPYTKQD
ncbi:hypothetical protein CISG_07731 [Coccidioides immitis RMSCC 3703]|uniref:Uncharacterized protein n=2 Tax=Coccidioides immitis TaxID=5501 RepID=A0A0J8R3J3_COCIT|nr:hypothetical protein CIRG_06501 [Coccidioides immitis RMSCC 2394]KMU79301.1 hypothetical protein CISG_07731 [Coccidioides immitis RMSCC 3703]